MRGAQRGGQRGRGRRAGATVETGRGPASRRETPHPTFKNVQPRLARVCEPEAASLEPRLKAPLL